MIGGIHGKILHINLSTEKYYVEHPAESVYSLLVGGRAFVAYYLLKYLPPLTDPLGQENLLIFAPGILQGTSLPGAGRHGVGSKSPLTGAIGSSEVGGWWGYEFKKTGFDALIIHGKAKKPVYIWVNNENIEIRSAEHLWGLTTGLTQASIQDELGDRKVRVAQIGPGGENLVLFAAIMHDVNRAAGRNGLGAVMGSKNLKAIAVRGTKQVPVADKSLLLNVAKWLGRNYKTKAAWATKDIGRGTQDTLMQMSYLGGLPTNNFGTPLFDDDEMVSGERNYEMFFKDRDTCNACPISCKQVFEHNDEDINRQLDPQYGGPEYESTAAFSSNCGINDSLAVAKANELSNAYGLDTISAGASIAFVMECFENGIITSSDTGGLEYRWGDSDLLVRSIEMIAYRRGFGNVLADGVNKMAKRFGERAEQFNLTIKGQELPMHEPRLKHAMGLGYAVAPVGADHMMNIHDTDYQMDGDGISRVNTILDKPVKPVRPNDLGEDKMQIFRHELNWRHFQDCAVTCHFYPYDYHHLAEALSGVTGLQYSTQDVLDVGARAQTLSKLFNIREGFREQDDKLPTRVMRAFESGPLAGVEITKESFEWAKHRYYELMNWDRETGVPSIECLRELKLLDMLKNIQINGDYVVEQEKNQQ